MTLCVFFFVCVNAISMRVSNEVVFCSDIKGLRPARQVDLSKMTDKPTLSLAAKVTAVMAALGVVAGVAKLVMAIVAISRRPFVLHATLD